MPSSDSALRTLFWSAATVALFYLARAVQRRWPRWWTNPVLVAPLLLMGLTVAVHESYGDYIGRTHWLVGLLGPTTVAFAIPIWEQRALIRRRWVVLLIGVLAGSATALVSAWALAHALGLPDSLRLSLLPRSISTPFAMTMSSELGGVPDLTAVFVIFTGILGATVGELLLGWLPLKTALARGAMFGMGAHGAGVARAHQLGREEGSIAGVVMVLVGLVNVLAAPWVAMLVR